MAAREHFDALSRSFEESRPGFFIAAQTRPGEYPTHHHEVQADVYQRSFWYQHREACILDLLKRHPVDWLLDVGGSHGMLTSAIQSCCPAALLEPDAAGANAAWERGVHPVFQGDLLSADLAKCSIAGIGLFDVLEHIPDDRQLLRRIHDLLEEDGKLFISVPAMSWLWSDFDDRVGHQRRYTRRLLRQRLRESGFEPLNTSYLFFILPIPMLMVRPWARRRQGVEAVAASSAHHHYDRASLAGRLLGAVLGLERQLLRLGLNMPFGSSCLCVAQKARA